MKSVVLYYFSGSGNTLKVVNKVKDTFDSKMYNCTIKRMEDVKVVDSETYEYVGLLFPVAIQSTFPLVWEFINRLPRVTNQKIFMIDTMEAFSGGVVGPAKKILLEKGYNCVAALEVKMSSSLRTKAVTNNELAEKNNTALNKTEVFIIDMLLGKGKWGRVPVLSDMMRNISIDRKIWTKSSNHLDLDHDKCIKCKICVRDCPLDALSFVDDKIAFNHELCNSCMRCVHNCPKDVFTWKGKKVIRC